MRFVLERVTDPEIEPVDLARMKRELKEYVSNTTRDDDITAKIVAAREWVEDYTGRSLIDQTWRLTVGQSAAIAWHIPGRFLPGYGYYCGQYHWSRVHELMLRRSPVLAITSIVTVDLAGAETPVDAANYELREADSKWPSVVPLNGSSWAMNTFRITFRAGFADRTGSPGEDASVVPERFKQAMILWVKGNYDCEPADMQAYVKAAEDLIKSERSNLQIA